MELVTEVLPIVVVGNGVVPSLLYNVHVRDIDKVGNVVASRLKDKAPDDSIKSEV
jgi:hypothetical protein